MTSPEPIRMVLCAEDGSSGKRFVLRRYAPAMPATAEPVPLLFLGGGRMADALIGGLIAAGHPVESLAVVEISEHRRQELARTRPGLRLLAEPVPAVAAVIATKPADTGGALTAVAAASGPSLGRALSIAAGVSTRALEEAARVGGRPGVAVVRAMPNTPALVGEGAAAICAGQGATDADLEWAEGVLGAVGTVVRVPERSMDAVTGLSGSGPAYVFLVAEALMDAGVLAGLPRDVADALTRQTLLGAATLLASSDEGPEELRAAVTSPGGTTAEGLRVLESAAVRAAVIDAVAAATERSAELGA